MILIGSTILLTLLVIQAWSTPIAVDCDDEECETFEIKYDLSEGGVSELIQTLLAYGLWEMDRMPAQSDSGH